MNRFFGTGVACIHEGASRVEKVSAPGPQQRRTVAVENSPGQCDCNRRISLLHDSAFHSQKATNGVVNSKGAIALSGRCGG